MDATLLVGELRWACDSYEKMQAVADEQADDRMKFIRKMHLNRLLPETKQVFEKSYGSLRERSQNDPQRTDEIAQVIQAAQKTTQKVVKLIWETHSPIGRRRNRSARNKKTRMRIDEKLQSANDDVRQLVMSQFPLVPLTDIRKPIFELLANQSYDPRTARNDKLLSVIQDNRAQQRPTLIVLVGVRKRDASHFSRIVGSSSPKLPSEIPIHESVQSQLARFGVLQLTTGEFTTLTDDLNQKPIEQTSWKKKPIFVLLDRFGKRVAIVMHGRTGYQLVEPESSKLWRTRKTVAQPLADAMLIARSIR